MDLNKLTNPKELFTPRNIAHFVVHSSIRFVITETVSSLVTTETRTERLKLKVGTYMIASLISDKAVEKIDKKFDGWKAQLDEAKVHVDVEFPQPSTDLAVQ